MNTEPIRLLSVVHTGTHFMMELFKRNGIENFSHYHYGSKAEPKLLNQLIVSPIRDPLACYVTCVSRDHLDDHFWKGWQQLNWHFEREPDMWVIPVDTPDRDEQLNLLGMRLGFPLETDWQPVKSGPRKEIEPVDLSEIYDLPVVQAFYTQKNLDGVISPN